MKRDIPKYCYRRGRKGYIYFIRGGYTKRMPSIDDPTFDLEYREASREYVFFIHNPEAMKEHGRKFNPSELDRHFEQLERGAKRRAKAAGREYALPKYWGADKYVEQDGVCALTGIVMRKGKGRMDPYSPSIDRIDSDKGYTVENCQLVIHRANIAKGDLSEREFVRMCRLVVMGQNKNKTEKLKRETQN